MSELYSRYHGRILRLATQATSEGAWKAKLGEILAEFDNDCRELSVSDRLLLCRELADQIHHEVLRFSDPTKRAVLGMALKHLDDN
jgi:hypothetical protein